MSSEINIEELERLAKAATPGPWKACGTVEQIGGDYKDIIPTSVSCMAYCYGGSADRAEDKDLIFIAAANPFVVLSLIDRLKKAESELERERMRLAACGVVALADTPESAAQAREMRDEYRSASYDDVARRVDECMTLRAERDALAALVSDLDESSSYWSEYEVPLGIVERIKEAAKTWKGGRQ